jgi:hypothetical protein
VTALAQRGGYRATPSYAGNVPYDGRFTFVRMSYPWYNNRAPYWSHDYPNGEENLLRIIRDLTNVPLHVGESSIMTFSDPEMFKNPVIYMCEPGYWSMSDAEVTNLRSYLLKGGFLIIDDFRFYDWGNFDVQMSRVFPDLKAIDLKSTHPIFHAFFEFNDPTGIHQYYDPGKPIFKGYFEGNDERKRMMVMVNYNTDISEFWEWSGTGFKPVAENNDAFKLGINEFVYGITH